MSPATKFLFDRRFGCDDDDGATGEVGIAPQVAIEADAEPTEEPPALFTEEDLERVRQDTLAFARKQAEADAADAVEDRIARSLRSIAEGLPDLVQAQREHQGAHARQAATVALTAVRKLFPTLNDQHASTEITTLIETVMARIAEAPKLTVRISPALKDPVAQRIEAVAAEVGFAGHLAVVSDDGLADGDCKLIWPSGGASRSAADIWVAIEQAVDRVIGSESAATEQTDHSDARDDRDRAVACNT